MRSHLRQRLHIRDASGVALVEFAFVLPVLLLVVIGMLEFGRAVNYWIDETHLANEGARFAAVNSNPGGGTLQEYIRAQGVTSELRDGTATNPGALQVCISFPTSPPEVGDPVVVTLSKTFTMRLLPLAPEIKGSATMRLEQLPTAYDAGCTA